MPIFRQPRDNCVTVSLQVRESVRKLWRPPPSSLYSRNLGPRLPRALPFIALTVCLCGRFSICAQSVVAPGAVKGIYVEPLGNKPGADALRAALIAELKKSHRVTVVSSPAAAGAVIGGTGETWIRGYYSLNPRARGVEGAQPIYGGYLSVELKRRENETLWSYLVTPRRFGPEDIGRNLCGQIVHKLLEILK